MTPRLYPHQQDAIKRLRNGSILWGGVGTGKSMTALGYYYYRVCKKNPDLELIIITTAHKRDSKEWELEASRWGLPFEYNIEMTIDSWNNIEKYVGKTDCFFIFDEHKAIGSGKWAKSFIKIARANQWILLTATPGDNWMDYISVFVAHGFYRNRTDFIRQHVIINPYVSYFSVKDYINVKKLRELRESILVEMPYQKIAVKEEIPIICEYDKALYNTALKDRWNVFEDSPIENASELCYVLRKICNIHSSRIKKVIELIKKHRKVIIFYNFDYELEALKSSIDVPITEWNGHRHDDILDCDEWAHLVQYAAGAEGWNCITTNVIIFYSLSYSYKATEQASGRIDRLNTPFERLYYYKLSTESDIDKAIALALEAKKEFNIKRFALEH